MLDEGVGGGDFEGGGAGEASSHGDGAGEGAVDAVYFNAMRSE